MSQTMRFCYLTTRCIDLIIIGMVVVLFCMHILDSLSCKVLLQGGSHNLEFLALSVTSMSVATKFCICLFYRPHASSPVSIFDNLCTTLQMFNPAQFSTFLLLGDFNVNFCNPQHYLFSHASDILYSFSIVQVVPSFAHLSTNGSTSLIDLALAICLTYLVSKVVPHSLHCHLLIILGCHFLLNGQLLYFIHNLPALSPDVSTVIF